MKRYEIGSVYKSKSDLYIMESNKLIKKGTYYTIIDYRAFTGCYIIQFKLDGICIHKFDEGGSMDMLIKLSEPITEQIDFDKAYIIY